MAKKKYVCVRFGGDVILSIGKTTDTKGYTIDVLEAVLPDYDASDSEKQAWLKESNKRMEAVCKFLNEKNL